jgi:hypothetical protein
VSKSAESLMRKKGRETAQRGFKIYRELESKFPAALRMSADAFRQVSNKTRAERRRVIRAFVFWLVVDFGVHSICHLKPKHFHSKAVTVPDGVMSWS